MRFSDPSGTAAARPANRQVSDRPGALRARLRHQSAWRNKMNTLGTVAALIAAVSAGALVVLSIQN